MRLKHLDLILATTIAAMNVIWALLPGYSPVIGIVLALPLVFVLPGYTLTQALFHKRTLDVVHRFILSLGLTLSIDILSGFILNVTPIGLRAISWAVFLGLLTTLFSLWVAYLRQRAGSNVSSPHWLRLGMREYVLLGLAAIVVFLSVRYTATGVTQEPHPGFTQFWMLPSSQANNSCAILIGVQSFELTPTMYRIVVTINGAQADTWPSIALTPQGEWNRSVLIKSEATTGSMYIEARLYRSDEPDIVYRNVHLTLHSSGDSKDGQIQHCVLGTQ